MSTDHHTPWLESAFVGLTQRLLSAIDSGEIAQSIVISTVELIGVSGAYIEVVIPGRQEVEVRAASGSGVPEVGQRTSYTDSVSAALDPGSGNLLRGPDLLAVPLQGGDELLGALVLNPDPAESGSEIPSLGQIRMIADLASSALRRVMLFEEAEGRRAEIERHLESKARLIRGFAHDLKNPIGAIDGYALVLEAGIRGDLSPAHREYVARIRAASRSMARLVDDLVELAHSETGELRLETQVVDPAELVGTIIDEYRASAAARGLALELRRSPLLTTFQTDPDRVRQILGNLLSNAIKYTPAPGRVTISTGAGSPDRAPQPGEWLTISVADTGPGIEPESQVEIFEEFARLSPESQQGAGLGLAISRHIAQALAGEVTVESTPGQGSTFTLWLPIS